LGSYGQSPLARHRCPRDRITSRAPGQRGLQMSTPPQTDINSARITIQTDRVLHDFVRNAVLRLSQVLSDAAHQSAPTFEDYIQFERGNDGHFRERKKHIRTLWPTLTPEWLHSLPDYEQSVDCLRSDKTIGPHLDCLVGTSRSAHGLQAEDILTSLIYATQCNAG
jgi:hypothetical protein